MTSIDRKVSAGLRAGRLPEAPILRAGRYCRSCLLMALILALHPAGAGAAEPEWTGLGSYRVLVRIDPVDLGDRPSDQLVARHPLPLSAMTGSPGFPAQPDLATLQVHKYDPITGQAETYPPFDTALSIYDRPCRFDDEEVTQDYPDRVGYPSNYATGRPPVTWRKRGARIFNRQMDSSSGYVVWVHTQESSEPSYYAIYWDARGPGSPTGPSPAPWIGDVDLYRRPTGQSLGGLAHFSLAAGDLNGDGLFDLVAGVEKGDLMWFPNLGTPGNPVFTGSRPVTDDEGPINLGWYAAPYIHDWDNDGLPDLIIGTSHNVILWWKNVGSTTSGGITVPHFTYKGFVQADGGRLEVPQSPVPEDISGSFTNDYYNRPWVGDWDGDGEIDLLTGGYTTGRIFFYRSTGRGPDGVPILQYAGEVHADGQPLDTGWAASPTAHDFDGNGRLELITGSWAFGQPADSNNFLMYFRNLGTQQSPNYSRVAFPKTGNFPAQAIARAQVADWNNDGRVDLIASAASGDVRVFLHNGSPSSPRWDANVGIQTIPWGFVRIPSFMSMADWDGDGQQEFLSGTAIWSLQGSIHSPVLVHRGAATVNGAPLFNSGPGYGDPYNWNIFWDWDLDGRVDILSGTQQGNLFFHRNLGAANNLAFDEGVKLRLTNGQDLKVGPPVYDDPNDVPDFTALQGSRMKMAVADFDGDGIDDLAITETFGNIWIFRNTVAGGTSTLAPGVRVQQSLPRLAGLDVVDWNNDSKPDLIAGLSVDNPGAIFMNQSSGSTLSFSSPTHPLNLPYVFWGPIINVRDYNDDGDDDFFIRSEFYFFWAERSFVEHGYRPGVAVSEPGWLSTFETGTDGVEYIYHSTTRDMIGTASNGRLPITVVNAASTSDFNRAGRPFGSVRGYQDAFRGRYKFSWSQLYEGPEQSGWGSVEFAGFVGESGGAMFRQMLGALLQHKKVVLDYHLRLGIMTGAGDQAGFLPDSQWINLGPLAVGTNYQLIMDYSGSPEHVLTLTFTNAAGGVIRAMSADLDNLLQPANLQQLQLTHLGWSDYSGSIGAWNQTDIDYVWQVDELEFQETRPSAQILSGACCLTNTGTCIEGATQTLCTEQSGTFGGAGSTCQTFDCQSACPTPFADFDRDGDVDQEDFGAFQSCLTGDSDPFNLFDPERCGCFDRDFGGQGDGDIDGLDLDRFLACMSGPNQPADPACENEE